MVTYRTQGESAFPEYRLVSGVSLVFWALSAVYIPGYRLRKAGRHATVRGEMTTTSAPPESKEPVRRHGAAIGLFTLVKVVLILALWAAGFIAFLTAPLLVLAIAAAIGFGWLALRRTKQEEAVHATTPRSGPRSHQFGANRGSTPLATTGAAPVATTGAAPLASPAVTEGPRS